MSRELMGRWAFFQGKLEFLTALEQYRRGRNKGGAILNDCVGDEGFSNYLGAPGVIRRNLRSRRGISA